MPRSPEMLEMRVARPDSTSLLFFLSMRLTSPSCTKIYLIIARQM